MNALIEESIKIRKTITENIEKNGFCADGSCDAAKHMELMETAVQGMLMEIERLKEVNKEWKKKALFGEKLVQVEINWDDYSVVQRNIGYIEGLVTGSVHDVIISDGIFAALEGIEHIMDNQVKEILEGSARGNEEEPEQRNNITVLLNKNFAAEAKIILDNIGLVAREDTCVLSEEGYSVLRTLSKTIESSLSLDEAIENSV